ncbi:ubiquinone/menaquinone biosynthesis methyltransferase [Terriglobus roseus DSM 18391]|uniref:Demethylmenaquinone methyltransferase n=1 Tax=Terriglobus roseus (strain DSM 18391 / NRRL B-41598 / KBS 63) TaxID=926566 RepID=I3ZCY2_TERRK|nr:bifunctional demethylmenaquinone methyltransferase/2-methoxy-6-polyprenyl-1,4-benzoquinol methylase UbiE [Terriglobus roseus]AFL87100.1 ubiquinone/menaquinone biosynthesis methyltransferase [Terriglobus roseus DSM 18391]
MIDPALGARPEGTANNTEAADAVQRMFDEIAPQYDRANHILSMGMDRVWWNRTARRFDPILRRPEARVLDLCCGTGDMTAALLARRPAQAEPILAIDFSHEMIERGREKMRDKAVIFIEDDALNLHVDNGTLDLVVSAFGFRNLADYAAGLTEIRRVLKPGGEIGILDFSMPPAPLDSAYRLYFKHILPRIGGMISGSTSSYEYLPASVERFPKPQAFCGMMRQAGFTDAKWKPYLFGIAGLWSARAV